MPSETGPSRWYQDLLVLNREAFAGALYETAYYALAAAFHCAIHLVDTEKIAPVERLAREQLAWIDAHEADHPISTQSAAKRGNNSLYAWLITEAVTALEFARVREERDQQGTSQTEA